MNKLKYFAATLLLFAVSFVGGCAGMDMHTKAAEAKECDRFVIVDKSGLGLTGIFKDVETGVLYLYNGNFACVMVDADGKPLVSEMENNK